MVFISYKSEDVELADRIKEILNDNGIDTWIDQDSISAGGDYLEEIPEGIIKSDVVVLILTNSAQESAWIPREIGFAIQENKTINPLVYNNITLSKKFDFLLLSSKKNSLKGEMMRFHIRK